MASGSVFVFNVNRETLDLSINGAPVTGGPIGGWSDDGRSKYQPNSTKVPRTPNQRESPGRFANGTNLLTLFWHSGSCTAKVSIDGQASPISEDLLLFINGTAWHLVKLHGAEVGYGNTSPRN